MRPGSIILDPAVGPPAGSTRRLPPTISNCGADHLPGDNRLICNPLQITADTAPRAPQLPNIGSSATVWASGADVGFDVDGAVSPADWGIGGVDSGELGDGGGADFARVGGALRVPSSEGIPTLRNAWLALPHRPCEANVKPTATYSPAKLKRPPILYWRRECLA